MASRYEGANLDFIRYRGAVASELRVGGDNTIAPAILIPTVTISVSFRAGNLSADLTAVAAGGAGGPYTYEWVNINDRSTIIETDATLNVTTDGTYEVVVTDTAGTTSEAECAIVDLNEGPSAVLTGPASRTTGQTTALTITVSDPDHPTTVTWTLTQNGVQITSGTGDTTNMPFSATARSTAGTDEFVLTATDPFNAEAMDTHNVSVTVPIPNINPQGSFPASGVTITSGGVTLWDGSTAGTATLAHVQANGISISGNYTVTTAASGTGDRSGTLQFRRLGSTGRFNCNPTMSLRNTGTFSYSGTNSQTPNQTGNWSYVVDINPGGFFEDETLTTLFTLT